MPHSIRTHVGEKATGLNKDDCALPQLSWPGAAKMVKCRKLGMRLPGWVIIPG